MFTAQFTINHAIGRIATSCACFSQIICQGSSYRPSKFKYYTRKVVHTPNARLRYLNCLFSIETDRALPLRDDWKVRSRMGRPALLRLWSKSASSSNAPSSHKPSAEHGKTTLLSQGRKASSDSALNSSIMSESGMPLTTIVRACLNLRMNSRMILFWDALKADMSGLRDGKLSRGSAYPTSKKGHDANNALQSCRTVP